MNAQIFTLSIIPAAEKQRAEFNRRSAVDAGVPFEFQAIPLSVQFSSFIAPDVDDELLITADNRDLRLKILKRTWTAVTDAEAESTVIQLEVEEI